jgi:penicillin-binding protein 1B
LRFRLQKGFWTSKIGLGILAAVAVVFLIAAGTFTFYYVKYARMIDARLSGHILQNTTQIFSAPERISDGQGWSQNDLITYLQKSGYRPTSDENSLGEFTTNGTTVDIRPSKLSYFNGSNALAIEFGTKGIRSIRPLSGGPDLGSAEIEPELITNLFDSLREKRRPVRYEDLPPVLIHAILSAEDKRFFEHPGFDFIRIFGAAWADLRHSQKFQGASTITMQVARTYFLSTDRTWRRKLAEAMLSFELERYSKQRIFEMYANEVYLGNRGSFGIRGFAEASVAYFGKDLRQLTLPECAFLAGLIRAPNYYSVSDRHPERAVQARDRVLTQMLDNGFVNEADVQDAKRVPLKLMRTEIAGNEAPYFVDMVKDHLLEDYSEADLLSQNYRVYTTLDPQLQRAAAAAVESGMKNVDALLAKRREKSAKLKGQKGEAPPPGPQVQVALVALDPHTGEIKALIGGRDYGQSQLNHALSHRQPGSVFKPFVYAAAFNNAVDGAQPLITPATTVDDEPTVFEFDGQEYTPNNYGERFMGKVTVRQALTNSLNVATVKVAEMVGYGRVVQVARKMGLGSTIRPTPAVALGAYELTPIEVAGAYTAFATMGTRADPFYIKSVTSAGGNTLEKVTPTNKLVLDPRVTYLVDSILVDVLNKGTGAAVRQKGFKLPAAGKTGTSRDGWFAGFTSDLVTVIWIGFDDNHDLGLAGGATAAPIWADFMLKATELPAYKDAKDFEMPDGIQTATIDTESLQLATPSCPETRDEVYVAGSAPTQICELHGGHGPLNAAGSFLSHIFGGGSPKQPENAAAPAGQSPNAAADGSDPNADLNKPAEKKKGPLQRIFGIFGGKKKDPDKDKPPG